MSGVNRGMNPRDALSPRANWQLIDVLYESEHWSMALGRWGSEETNGALFWRSAGMAVKVRKEIPRPTVTLLGSWCPMTYELYIDSDFIQKESGPS